MACEMPGCSPVIALPHVPPWVVRITVYNYRAEPDATSAD